MAEPLRFRLAYYALVVVMLPLAGASWLISAMAWVLGNRHEVRITHEELTLTHRWAFKHEAVRDAHLYRGDPDTTVTMSKLTGGRFRKNRSTW